MENNNKPIKPKFRECEWTVSNLDKMVRQISEVHFDEYNSYYVVDGKSVNLEEYDRLHHLWTVEDAKEGDVLATSAGAFIYNGNNGGGSCPGSYCGIDTLGGFKTGVKHHWTGKKVYPATKEQRDQLKKAIAEAGYEWNAEKKELRKIENEIEIPFGAKDSELQEATYYIPKGFHAEIEDNKVVIKKGEKPTAWSEKDKDYINDLVEYFSQNERLENTKEDIVIWLRTLKDRFTWKPSDEQIKALEEVIDVGHFTKIAARKMRPFKVVI